MEESLGPYLQRVRAEKGYSLNDIAAKTRIGLGYLKDLEAEDFSKMPAHVVAKSYVKTYARCLGLQDAEALKHFGEVADPFYRQRDAAQAKPRRPEHPLKSRLDEFVSNLKLLF
jgi:cytoskeletal protein RodZ